MAISRRVWVGVSAVALWIMAAMASAQLRPVGPFGRLWTPTPVAPTDVVAYDYQAPDVTFVWDQQPLFPTPYDALPTHFLFCMNNRPCSHANAVATLLPDAIPSTLVQSGHRYFYTPVIPDDQLDRDLWWSVGACTGNDDSSCRFSDWEFAPATTVELRAGNISGNLFGETYRLIAEGQNHGSRPTRELPTIPVARIRSWEVLLDSISQTCRTDPNAADIRGQPDHFVIDNKGEFTRFENLPRDKAGNYITSNVVAIFGVGNPFSDYLDVEIELSDLPLGPPSPLQGALEIYLPASDRPIAVLTVLGMDDEVEVLEVDETNNRRAECEVIF